MKTFLLQKIIITIFFLHCLATNAQEIAIPYRDGNLWGICNPQGNMIIEPKFQKLDFDERDDVHLDVIYSTINNKKGLIIKGKEILKPEYNRIFFYRGAFVAYKHNQNSKEVIIVDADGDLIAENIIDIINSEDHEFYNDKKVRNKVIVFHTLNKNNKENLFVWDVKQKKITQWIYKDYHFIKRYSHEYGYNEFLFYRSKQNENSPLNEQLFQFKKGVYEKHDTSHTKATLSEVASENQTNSDNYGSLGSGGGVSEGRGYHHDMKGDSGDYLTIEAPTYVVDDPNLDKNKPQKVIEKPKVYIYKNLQYSIKDKSIILEKSAQYNSKDKKETILDLKGKIKELKIVKLGNYDLKFTKNDTIFSIRSIVTYKNGNKYGVLIGDSQLQTKEFDTLVVKQYTSHEVYQHKLSFIVGNKEKKTNKFKMTILDSNLKEVFPLEYDAIYDTYAQGGSDYNQWIGVKNGKYGIINPNGTILLESIYDEIKDKKNGDSYNMFLQLKKDNKYGAFTRYKSKTPEIFPTIFQYPISKIYYEYPFITDSLSSITTEQKKSAIPLFLLVDTNGKIMGYADKYGKPFYKN